MVLPSPKGKLQAASADAAGSPEPVGIARQTQAKERGTEIARRIDEYAKTMSLLKSRGVKGLAPPVAGAAAAPTPLQVFVEGDSWFDYPVPFFGGGVIPRLEQKLGLPILNLAKAGDEVRAMLGVEERLILIDQFSQGSPAGGKWDVLLFSGGGNDIVGNPMALWIKDFRVGASASQFIEGPRFAAALAIVKAGYEDLIALRDALSPNTHLVFHAYDFAIPDGRGICGLGPWLKPTFDLRKFPPGAFRFNVVKAMLQEFATMLQQLEQSHAGITFLNLQGTLAPVAASWHNELHPSAAGFTTIANLFHQKLKSLFPARVP